MKLHQPKHMPRLRDIKFFHHLNSKTRRWWQRIEGHQGNVSFFFFLRGDRDTDRWISMNLLCSMSMASSKHPTVKEQLKAIFLKHIFSRVWLMMKNGYITLEQLQNINWNLFSPLVTIKQPVLKVSKCKTFHCFLSSCCPNAKAQSPDIDLSFGILISHVNHLEHLPNLQHFVNVSLRVCYLHILWNCCTVVPVWCDSWD